MLKSDKISSSQATLMLVIGVLPTSLMALPAFITEQAGTDSWLSVIFAALIGFAVIAIAVTLGKRFPGKTIIEYSENIAGKIISKIIGFIFFWYFLYLTAIVVREFAGFSLSTTTPEIPIEVLIISFLLIYSSQNVLTEKIVPKLRAVIP